jgi:hypothetical protein
VGFCRNQKEKWILWSLPPHLPGETEPTLGLGRSWLAFHAARASAITQSSCMPPGAPVRTLPWFVTE